MKWLILLAACVFEISWLVGLKYSASFTKLWPSVFTIITMIASIFLLSIAARYMPMGTAYAVWTGLSMLGFAVLGILFMGEPAGMLRMFFILLIVAGVAGLKLLENSAG